MPSFTLIIPTMGRTQELNVLFESIVLQSFAALDCLVIDQNPDDRLGPILNRWSSNLAIRRLRAAPGVSHARNLGLQHAAGDIIAFPDDDCWYSSNLLQRVAVWFDTHPAFDILTVGAQDERGVASGNRWPQHQCEIRPINVFRTTFCSSIFLRRSSALNETRFDETIGPGAGTSCSCAEETDYILSLRRRGLRGFFDRRLYVGHPKRDMLSGQIDWKRAVGYGCGMGYVLRKHSLLLLGAAFLLYDLLRSILVVLKGDLRGSSLCLHHARGLLSGLTTRPAQLGASRS